MLITFGFLYVHSILTYCFDKQCQSDLHGILFNYYGGILFDYYLHTQIKKIIFFIILYYTGNSDLNQAKIVSVVGTRQITSYGEDLVRRFIADLRQQCPKVLIVSGLAYGVDINAHRQALEYGYETVGVLAHGLDQIYPYRHKEAANEMVKHGGLLTEFMTLS